MIIGSGWRRKDKNGKQYLSIQVQIPLLGNLSLLLYVNEQKKNEKSPDYNVVWIPDTNKPDSIKETTSYDDEEIPF